MKNYPPDETIPRRRGVLPCLPLVFRRASRVVWLISLAALGSLRAELKKDITYGTADGQHLLLDAHVPDGPGPFPVAILVHGGGWTNGDKGGSDHPGNGADVSPWFGLLSGANYTWFSINYRMAPKHRWPAQIEDLDTAIRWVKVHAAEYKGDPGRVVLFGHSAGGHMVMFAATQSEPDLRVQATVGFAPVTDLVADSERRGGLSLSLQALFGLGKEITPEARAVLWDASPIAHVHPGMPPVLIVQGDADRTVPIQQSQAFIARLQTTGVPCRLITRHGVPHSLVAGEKIDTSYRAETLAWLQEIWANLGAPATATAAGAEQPIASNPATPVTKSVAWQPDNRDGTYKNPVLFADYSDPDVIRVGDDFWLTSSSFSHVPGLPILHSRDLVNWSLVNHALPRLEPIDYYSQPRHGGGVWAPAIRFHAGKFWIYYPDPDFGIYVVTAADPRGQWSQPALVMAGKGLIDPCPFWDEDGDGYLVHAWAKSRSGIANRLTLCRLTPDGLHVVDGGKTIIDADTLPGWHTLEGPKLYRRGAYYYIFAPAGGVTGGYQAVFRAKNIEGPYEPRVVLEQGDTPVNGPHQGAWVETPAGQSWFVHFQDRGPYGRVVLLEPMHWRDDGWPEMGVRGPKGVGKPVLTYEKPAVASAAPSEPATSDDFAGRRLGLQWQWQCNPASDWATLKPGTDLQLNAVPHSGKSLWDAGNLLMQKFPAPHFVVTTRIDASRLEAGNDAGLVVFGYDYGWIGVRRTADGLQLARATCKAANEGGVEAVDVGASVTAPLFLRVSVDDNARCSFAYSTDGKTFVTFGSPLQATVSRWVGTKVGLFARASAKAPPGGYLNVRWFHVTAN